MYGQTTYFDLPLISLKYEPVRVPAEITPTVDGLVFRFRATDNDYNIFGTLTVRTDAGAVTEIEIGTPDIDEQIEICDWGFGHLRIGPGHADTIADLDIDEQTLDLFQCLLASAMAYAQGHAARIAGRLAPPTTQIEP
jgi:hypothetical protein